MTTDYPSSLYLIGEPDEGPVKIGYANRPKHRLATLQTGNPRELGIITWVPGGRDAEQALLELARPWRINREWHDKRDFFEHYFDALWDHLLGAAQERLGFMYPISLVDDEFYAVGATPADIRHVWGRVKPFFDFMWAGGDPEAWEGTPEEQAERAAAIAEQEAWLAQQAPG